VKACRTANSVVDQSSNVTAVHARLYNPPCSRHRPALAPVQLPVQQSQRAFLPAPLWSIFWPSRMQDAACCYSRSSVVCVSVGHVHEYCTKRLKNRWGGGLIGSRNHVLDGYQIPHGKGAILRVVRPVEKH